MALFNEATTVRDFMYQKIADNGWKAIEGKGLDRKTTDPCIPSEVEEALIRLNPVLAKNPGRVNEVLPKIMNTIYKANSEGLMSANKDFIQNVASGFTHMVIDGAGDSDDYVTIKVFDFENLHRNSFIVSKEVTYKSGSQTNRFDLVLWVNGLPLGVIECKGVDKPWADAVNDIEGTYTRTTPEFFTTNVLNVACNGLQMRYGAIDQPSHMWQQWGSTQQKYDLSGIDRIVSSINLLLSGDTMLNIMKDFTLFQKRPGGKTIKIIPRYIQMEAAEAIQKRVREGDGGNGLIHHYQGTGKTLLMVFTACKLLEDSKITQPTVLIVVDRLDLQKNVFDDFHDSNLPVKIIDNAAELKKALTNNSHGVIITTIFKFHNVKIHLGEVWNTDDNIIVMVDEAHRTQDGDLGINMRQVLPHARFFGMTGTPVNDKNRNTFAAFGNTQDENSVLSKYSMERAIADGTSVPIVVEPRLVDWNLNKDQLEKEFETMAEEERLTKDEKSVLSRTSSQNKAVVENEERVRIVCEDIVEHFTTRVAPLGFKAQVVAYDRDMCVRYEQKINEILRSKGLKYTTQVVMTVDGKEDEARGFGKYYLSRNQENKIIDRFNKHDSSPHILIVTSKLLTGFNAPIEQTIYIDKPMQKETLFQAITRSNRTYTNPVTGQKKEYGVIVDYVGIAKNIAAAITDASDKDSRRPVDIEGVIDKFEEAFSIALDRFEGIDRTSNSFETLNEAVRRFPNEESQREYAREFLTVQGLWETLYPHPATHKYYDDYEWLAGLYRVARNHDEVDHTLLIERLGAKTKEIVNKNVTDFKIKSHNIVEISSDTIDDLRTLSDLLGEEGIDTDTPITEVNVEEILDTIDKRIKYKLSTSDGSTVYASLAKQLEALRRRSTETMEQTKEFIEKAIDLARKLKSLDNQEKASEISLLPDDHIGALSKIVIEYKPKDSSIVVTKMAEDIDEIARKSTFSGWIYNSTGDKEVKKSIRKVLKKYHMPPAGELFNEVYEYVSDHY